MFSLQINVTSPICFFAIPGHESCLSKSFVTWREPNRFWGTVFETSRSKIEAPKYNLFHVLLFFSGWLVVMLWRFYKVAKFGSSSLYICTREVQLTHLLLNYPQPVEIYRFIRCLCSHVCMHIYIKYIGMYCVCLVLELFILSLRILISKEARSTIVPLKKPKQVNAWEFPSHALKVPSFTWNLNGQF